MNNCKDCAFWDSHQDYKGRTWHTCELPDWIEAGDWIANNEIAFFASASDDTGLTAGVITGPMFGCVRFVKD